MFDKKDFFSGLFLFALGLFLAFQCRRLSVWSRFGPDEGFFPLVVAIVILGLSLSIIIKSFHFIGTRKERPLEDQKKEAVDVFRVISYVILMLLYSSLMETVGFLITSPLFLILLMKYIEKQGWKITILVGSGSIIISYLLFVYFLNVPLPKGLMKWW